MADLKTVRPDVSVSVAERDLLLAAIDAHLVMLERQGNRVGIVLAKQAFDQHRTQLKALRDKVVLW